METSLKLLVAAACVTTLVCGSVYIQKNVGFFPLPYTHTVLQAK